MKNVNVQNRISGFIRITVMMILTAVCFAFIPAVTVNAAGACVAFGSESYTPKAGKECKIGVYVKCMDGVGASSVTVGYDPNCLEYVGGGSGYDLENGLVFIVDETGNGANSKKFMLIFRAKTESFSEIHAVANYVYTYDFPDVIMEDGTVVPCADPVECTITGSAMAPIMIQGTDPKPEEKPVEKPEEKPEDKPEEVVVQEEETEVIEEQVEEPEEAVTEETEVTEEVVEEQIPVVVDAPVVQEPVEEITVVQEEPDTIVEANPLYFTDGSDDSVPEKTLDESAILMLILIGSGLALLLLLWMSRDEFKARKNEAKRYVDALEDPNYEENKDEYIIELPDENKTQDDGLYSEEDIVSEIGGDTTTFSEQDLQIINMDEHLPVDDRERVIAVKDVTMEFHLSTYNPSGLKDYLIQMVKRNISYRRLYALYHVSFDVYKGEVIGIIGTNGSGKSTLLKIVSGALRPTSGSVSVDRKKVQLLTLGTGFDMELTARENVYLNGSIIGYSKDFLDKHYDDIVKFAELEDFMEEKVKNFSSGMVSRLGFAIATAGDAAEILILDEVLSVGDEFFRKKSLARIKEMIHGGSTVLIVSHGMNTILDNCTRCVWIEKGELRMVGNPKEVCDAYRHMEQSENAVGA